MESFETFNYYTTNETRWIEIINASTADWNVGHLPPGIIAIQGALNDTKPVPSGTTYIIERAGSAEVETRAIEQIIFGVLSGLVILWAGCWLYYHWRKGILFSKRGSSSHPTEADGSTSLQLRERRNGNNSAFISFDDFKAQLDVFYEAEVTELELYRRTLQVDGALVEDVEAALELLRKMYLKDAEIWATQSSMEHGAEHRKQMKDERDAMLADLRATVKGWDDPVTAGLAVWTQHEQDVVKELKEILDGLEQ